MFENLGKGKRIVQRSRVEAGTVGYYWWGTPPKNKAIELAE